MPAALIGAFTNRWSMEFWQKFRLCFVFDAHGSKWQDRNLELVFHAKVIGNSPSASDLIAWHVW